MILVGCDRRESRHATSRAVDARSAIPQRIVTIAPNAAEIIAALGAGDRLVGVSTFCLYPPELAALPRVGGLIDADLERIVSLKPDLVVIRGRNQALSAMCEELGIRLYRDPTDRFEDIYTTIGELGEILDRRDAADAMVTGMRQRLARLRSAIGDRARPRVLLVLMRTPGEMTGISTAGRDSFMDELITLAGGENVFGTTDVAWPRVSAEEIVAARPEVIVELMPEIEVTEVVRRSVLDEWRTLGPLPAVEHGRVMVMDDNNTLIPSPRIVATIERLAKLLHPEIEIE